MNTATFKIQTYTPQFKRWEVLQMSHNGFEAIVTGKLIRGNGCTYNLHTYKPPKNRILKRFYLLWIKLKVHYS